MQLNQEESEERLAKLQHKLLKKERQLESAWESYGKMQDNLVQIEQEIKEKTA